MSDTSEGRTYLPGSHIAAAHQGPDEVHASRKDQDNLLTQSNHIGQLINMLLPFGVAFLILSAVAYLIFETAAYGFAALVLCSFVGTTLLARHFLRQKDNQTAVVTICASVLGCSVFMLPIWPSLAPTLALTPLVTVGVALSFVESRNLKLLLIGAWIAVSTAVISGELLNDTSSVPDWFDSVFRATSMIAAATLSLLLLWQFRARLTKSLYQSREAEALMRHAATHDALTGLPSRTLLELRLKDILANPEQAATFSVLFLDLDRFKHVNDSLGHAVGDELLKAVSDRLLSCTSESDTVARLGGDEFVVLQLESGEREAKDLALRIQDALKAPVTFYGHELYITASIGIVCDCSTYQVPGEILRDADTAMYRAKTSGKARHTVFDRRMRQRAVSLLRLDSDLRRGVENGEFTVRYQPIVWLASRGVSGFEALVRWHHPERGLLPPSVFMKLAEETGLVNDIDDFVLKDACRQLALWRESGEYYPPSVSVNISPLGLSRPSLPDQISHILAENGLPGRALALELTESAIMEDPESALATLNRIKALGVRIFVDDFGTGYSSLWLLQRFPVDALKVDKSFVKGMSGEDSSNARIVETILTLAHSLGMEVIAEGVETTEQLEALRNLGCDYVQGYKFSKPVHSEVAEAILNAEPVW